MENDHDESAKNLTGQGLADFAEGRIGTPYFYGAKIYEFLMRRICAGTTKTPDLVTDDYGTGKTAGTGWKSEYRLFRLIGAIWWS